MRKITFILYPLILLFTGCAMTGTNVYYNVGIDQVERPADAEERYGEYKVTEQDTAETTEYVYEDDLLAAGWLFVNDAMLLTVENKTDHSIKVLLNEGAFVMPSGGSQRILTGDMSYSERNNEVQPIVVPKGATSSAMLLPADNLNFGDYGLSITPILQPASSMGEVSEDEVRENVGKKMSILLPVEIQDTVNEYTFTFRVAGAKLKRGADSEPVIIGQY